MKVDHSLNIMLSCVQLGGFNLTYSLVFTSIVLLYFVLKLRVSAVITNAPIVLTQDCDMYSNDPLTLMRVLCYYVDPSTRHILGYVQFPQRYHWINKDDTYGGEVLRLLGFMYRSLVEDYFTGYRLQCEGWESIFCHPSRPAFLGDVSICFIDAVGQTKRWVIGFLEVSFSKYTPVVFGARCMGFVMGLCYAHSGFWAILSIPITIYSFLTQIALLNGLCIFPKVTDPWFLLYVFLFLGAYGQDCYDFILFNSTYKKWWNDQRMWLIKGLSSYSFGLVEYIIKRLGIATKGFNVTSKVQDDEQTKRYDQGLMEFRIHSQMFVPFTTASIVNLFALIFGMIRLLNDSSLDKLFVQMFIAGFGVLNSWPVYEAMILRSDKGERRLRPLLYPSV